MKRLERATRIFGVLVVATAAAVAAAVLAACGEDPSEPAEVESRDASGAQADLGPEGEDAMVSPEDEDGGSQVLPRDAQPADDGVADGAPTSDSGESTPSLGAPWDGLSWRPIQQEADATGDCGPGDPACSVDLLEMRVAFDGGKLAVDLEFASAFPVQEGSCEVFFIPPDLQRVGRSVRYNFGYWEFWSADCSSVAPEQKHSGCHWVTVPLPGSFETQWGPGGHVLLSVSLAELGLEGVDPLLLGVAAAPTWIQRSAEFTERHPDELWLTATGISGLAEVAVNP